MEHTLRLFSCLRCHSQVVICSRCDRGQIYCDPICSNTARLQSRQAAEKRYQHTLKGRMKHALRQRRYRARLKEIVTDHSSSSPAHDDLLQTVKNKAKKAVISHGDNSKRCCFCKKIVSPWLRQGFLRHHHPSSSRDLSYFRPP
jgi:hypothetical protein